MEKPNFLKQLFLVVVGIVVFLYIISKIVGVDKTEVSIFNTESAYYNSKQFVKNILKAPATAKFEDDCTSCAIKQEDGTWFVKSYVDAQNSFGALLRQNYECRLSYDPVTDMVKCISVRLTP